MKLWLILHVLGQIGGTWGPLDADVTMEDCQSVAAEQKEGMDANKVVGGVRASDIEFSCAYSETRPELGTRWKGKP